ncbi:MAG: family 20 glycosylhydrolase, partial [Abditibacteriaceae bacterium]
MQTTSLSKNKSTNRNYNNWIHLDMKGMIPSPERLGEWLEWIAVHGFEGVVFEYEDRLPWQTFQGTYRPGFDLNTWQQIWDNCKQLGLTVTPLIQTFGHLECLLKHERWAHLRCDNHVNLLCPQHPEIHELLAAWVEEVARLHPDSEYMHVGLDEVYHFAECAQCQAQAEQSPHGKMGVLIQHAAFVCETVVKKGKRPIIWADMFIGENGVDLVDELPSETVLCDWSYGEGAGENTRQLSGQSGRGIMAASAIRSSFHTYFLMANLAPRIENVMQWHNRIANGEVGSVSALIHTVWSRSRGLSPLYGPWEGWIPSFLLAGNPSLTLSAPLQRGMKILERGQKSTTYDQAHDAAGEMAQLHSDDAIEEAALRWWELSLRHASELFVVQFLTLGYENLRASIQTQGTDPDLVDEMHDSRAKLNERLSTLRNDIAEFLQCYQWSESDEYLNGTIDNITRVIDSLP